MRISPFIWLHLRLTASPRMVFALPLILAAVILAASTSTISAAARNDRINVISTWLMLISLGQAVLLFILTPAAIRKAVLRDTQTGMLESHRISPLSNLSIVLGYLVGPAILSLLLFAAVLPYSIWFLSQISIGGLTSTTLLGWWFSLACLLILALMNAAMVLLNAVSSGGKGNLMVAAIVGGMFGGFIVIRLVPGLALITGIMSGGILYGAMFGRPGSTTDPTLVIIAAGIQLLITLLCIAATARKVRSPQQPAFSLPLGFALLAVCGVALLFGLRGTSQLMAMFGPTSSREQLTQVVSSACVFYLFGMIPIMTAAKHRSDRHRKDSLSGSGSRGALWRFDVIAPIIARLTLAALAFGLLQVASAQEWTTFRNAYVPALLITLALLASAWTDYQICLAFALRGWNMARGLLYALVALTALPPLIDVLIWAMGDAEERRQPMQLLFAAGSPFGLMSVVYSNFSAATVGLSVQILFAVLATIFAFISRRQALPEPAAARPTPPAPTFPAPQP